MMGGHVYILASRKHGTLYVGMTSDLIRRIYEHREGTADGFTRRHGIKRLMHIEAFTSIKDAIAREKQLKNWHRDWKIALLERENPLWDDLAVSTLGFDPLPTTPTPLRHPGESRDPRTRSW